MEASRQSVMGLTHLMNSPTTPTAAECEPSPPAATINNDIPPSPSTSPATTTAAVGDTSHSASLPITPNQSASAAAAANGGGSSDIQSQLAALGWKLETVPAEGKPIITTRPANSFILYRRDKSKEITALYPTLNQSAVSRMVADLWRKESAEVKERYRQLQYQARAEFEQQLIKINSSSDPACSNAASPNGPVRRQRQRQRRRRRPCNDGDRTDTPSFSTVAYRTVFVPPSPSPSSSSSAAEPGAPCRKESVPAIRDHHTTAFATTDHVQGLSPVRQCASQGDASSTATIARESGGSTGREDPYAQTRAMSIPADRPYCPGTSPHGRSTSYMPDYPASSPSSQVPQSAHPRHSPYHRPTGGASTYAGAGLPQSVPQATGPALIPSLLQPFAHSKYYPSPPTSIASITKTTISPSPSPKGSIESLLCHPVPQQQHTQPPPPSNAARVFNISPAMSAVEVPLSCHSAVVPELPDGCRIWVVSEDRSQLSLVLDRLSSKEARR
ncbi:hypothetical protein EV182_000041 [Spiromyces aspiralis]|uniref:Uncharacterized protein n=1 Tax=Spiromyces aspiralis TaxID=68401 RepID=A0ACC1HHH2_9FUNG|nr:hypothetical protein EV182_000041 [Spiromyces aspiralis]